MSILKRLFSIVTALAITLTASCALSMEVYAKVYTLTYSNPSVSTNQIVTSDYIRNYTKGMSIYASSQLTFQNGGGVNVSGGSFTMTNSVSFENTGTFTFTGTNSTFSLGNQGSFVNNGTATIKGVYNFGIQSGTSFINNGTLYLEDISNFNLSGFVNNSVIIIPDDAKNSRLHLALESKNGENGQVYTQSDFENRRLNYLITYEGLNADNYWDFDNSSNPSYYEWAAADPQNVTLADPTLGGYEFLGWTGLDITEPTKNFTFSSSVRTDVTFTAHWQPVVYTIDYDLDGGSFYASQTPPTEYKRGQQKGIPCPYKDGYTFNGWIDTDTNDLVNAGNDSYFYMPTSALGNKTYKASFIANSNTKYTIICYYQNIDGTYNWTKFFRSGETDTQVSVSSADYGKAGFSFDEDNLGNVLSGTIKADNSLELKLYFDRNQYDVTFKSQDGSETLWTTKKYYGETIGEYGGTVPAKESDNDLYIFVFDNWAREEPNRDFGYEVDGVVVYEDITFYAAFKQVRDESVVVVKWEAYDGFVQPAQTETRLNNGETYTIELQLASEKYYVGTREWTIGAAEAHVYWYGAQTGETGVDYTLDKAGFDAPVVLTIPNVQHDTFIKLKAHYHDEHDYSQADDTVISNGNCETDSVVRHFCYKCGKTYDETVPAGGHVTPDKFETDETSHRKICTICGESVGLEAHTPDMGKVTHEPTHNSTGTKTYTCTVCGYVTKRETLPMIPHSAETGWQSNGNTHYKLCSCGERLEEAAHTPDNGTLTLAPTYDTEGKKEYRCTVCGYLIGEASVSPLGHNVENEWQSELSGHWQNCECGERHNFGEHISDGGKVTIEPTYEVWGEKVYSCTVCGYVLRTETILPLSHKTDGEWVSDKDNHWKEGCGCGEKHELSPHTSDTGTVTIYPTASENGKIEYRCTVCGEVTKTEIIDKLEHTHIYGTEWKYDTSEHWHECVCGEKLDEAAHTPDNGTVTLAPTYDTEGRKEYRCTVCGYVLKTEVLPALGGGSDIPVEPSKPIPPVPSIPSHDSGNDYETLVVPTASKTTFNVRIENKITGKNVKAKATRTGENVAVNLGRANNGYYANICDMDGNVLDAVEIKLGKAKFKIQPEIDFYIIIDKNSYLEYEDVSSAAGATDLGSPIDMASSATNGVRIPQAELPRGFKLSNKKRRYRILKKRRLDDLVFVF